MISRTDQINCVLINSDCRMLQWIRNQ